MIVTWIYDRPLQSWLGTPEGEKKPTILVSSYAGGFWFWNTLNIAEGGYNFGSADRAKADAEKRLAGKEGA